MDDNSLPGAGRLRCWVGVPLAATIAGAVAGWAAFVLYADDWLNGVIVGAVAGAVVGRLWCAAMDRWTFELRGDPDLLTRLRKRGLAGGILAGVVATVLLHLTLMALTHQHRLELLLAGQVFGIPAGVMFAGAVTGAIGGVTGSWLHTNSSIPGPGSPALTASGLILGTAAGWFVGYLWCKDMRRWTRRLQGRPHLADKLWTLGLFSGLLAGVNAAALVHLGLMVATWGKDWDALAAGESFGIFGGLVVGHIATGAWVSFVRNIETPGANEPSLPESA